MVGKIESIRIQTGGEKREPMKREIKSIRPFIGAQNYEMSRQFYRAIGFQETTLGPKMSVFEWDGMSFYLQDAYVKDWIDNTMVFLEVADVDTFYAALVALDLPAKYPGVRLLPIRDLDWGRECFLHDPSGVLWHIGVMRG
jgi:hypothetical protein